MIPLIAPSTLFFSLKPWVFASGVGSSGDSAVKPELEIKSSGLLIVRVGRGGEGRYGTRVENSLIEVNVEVEEMRCIYRDFRSVGRFMCRLMHIKRQSNTASAPVGPSTTAAIAPLLNDGEGEGTAAGLEEPVGVVVPPE